MKNFILISLLSFFLIACGGGGGGGGGQIDYFISSDENAIPVSVSRGINNDYLNGLFGSVTVCKPNTSDCIVVDNVLFDTGSFGIRILNSALPQNFLLGNKNNSGETLTGCANFYSGYSWGEIADATIKLGKLTSIKPIPIQIINQVTSGATAQVNCTFSDTPIINTSSLKFNGVIGIGVLAQDCGYLCDQYSDNGYYFNCISNLCNGAAVKLEAQVSNPILYMPNHNNGTVISLPSISASGARNPWGNIYMGIGTAPNNTFNNLKTIGTNNYGTFKSSSNGVEFPNSFIDSGTNVYGLKDSSLVTCSNLFFCPVSELDIPVTLFDKNSLNSISSNIFISNAATLLSNGNNAFYNIGYFFDHISIDFGLPFFFGKNIATGIEGTSSNLGAGTYVAF